MNTSLQTRRPAGTPVGGQYAPSLAAAPALTLESDDPWGDINLTPEPVTPAPASAHAPIEPEPVAEVAAPVEPEATDDEGSATDVNDWAEIRALAYKTARLQTRSSAMDGLDFAEDISQEVTIALLKQSAGVKVSRTLVTSVTRNMVARAWHASRAGGGRENLLRANSSDMKAWKILSARRNELERTTGRALNHREIAAMADQIREEWDDPRHRPTPTFHEGPQFLAGETTTEDGQTRSLYDLGGNHNPSAEEEAMDDTHLEGSFMTAALDAVDAPDADGRNKTPLRLLYNALAENRNAPLAVAGAMSQRRCTRARKVVGTTSEEVLAVAEDWAQGNDTESTELFFAPYGENLTTAEKNDIVDMYRDLGAHAGDLYASAVMYANNRTVELVEQFVS